MKRLGVLFALLLFFISGCQTSSDINTLISKIDDFEQSGNQFEMILSVEVDITQNDQTESVSESVSVHIQIDPYYTSITSGNTTIVEIIEDDLLKTYTMDNTHIVNGKQLYSKGTVLIDEIQDPFSDLEFDLSKVEVTEINRNEFQINGKLVDFMPESMMDDLKEVLMGSGISEEEINDISIELLFKFSRNSLEYDITMNFDLNDLELEIRVGVIFTKQSFELLDFDDTTKFYPMSSNETQDPIDISQPIVFTADNYHVTSYYAYFEAGKYGFYSNVDIEHHTIAVYDETGGASNLRVFKEEYNRYSNNTNNISRFYNIPTDGYYSISINYPPSPDPYIIEVRKIESVTDGTETPTLTVSESGIYNYEIESAYDFFSIDFDLENDAFVTIIDSNVNHLYYNYANESYFHNIDIPEPGCILYMNETNQLVYLHNPNGPSTGTLTIEVTSIVHATSPDESMLFMKEQFNDELVVTGYPAPIQYIAIEVTERKLYTFEFLMSSGDIEEVKGVLYRENRTFVSGISNNRTVALMPGNYYFETSNDYDSIYSVRAVISDITETAYHIDSLQSHDVLYGNLSTYPQFNGDIENFGEFVVYYFSLSETTDIALGQSSITYELYDSTGNRIDIARLSDMFVYRLPAGDYSIIVIPPVYFTEDNFPMDYSLILFKFTGGGLDTSVYPFVEEITLGWGFTEATMDFTGDYDGYNFTLTKTETVYIYSTERAILLQGNKILFSGIERKEVTLEAGTYTIMCNTYNPRWTFSVRVVTP